jgi:hypothetical protein
MFGRRRLLDLVPQPDWRALALWFFIITPPISICLKYLNRRKKVRDYLLPGLLPAIVCNVVQFQIGRRAVYTFPFALIAVSIAKKKICVVVCEGGGRFAPRSLPHLGNARDRYPPRWSRGTPLPSLGSWKALGTANCSHFHNFSRPGWAAR